MWGNFGASAVAKLIHSAGQPYSRSGMERGVLDVCRRVCRAGIVLIYGGLHQAAASGRQGATQVVRDKRINMTGRWRE